MLGTHQLFELLEFAYPNMYKPLDMLRSPNDYWNAETSYVVLVDLVENKLGWTPEECYAHLTTDVLFENGLRSVYKHYEYSIENVLSALYPEMFDYSKLKSYRMSLAQKGELRY